MSAQSSVLLSVVVTAHEEGRLLRPTLTSIRDACRSLSEHSRVELILVCDNADLHTMREADHWAALDGLPFSVHLLKTSFGESGASRNEGVRYASGCFVAVVDGDDLVSGNYFEAGIETIRPRTRPTVAHPALVLSFGHQPMIWEIDSTDVGGFSYLDLLRHNLWPSSSLARRETYLANPFRSLAPSSGHGPEDWAWNIDTVAHGVDHVIAPDTMFFYRLRRSGGVNSRHSSSVLPPIDLSALRARLPVVDTGAVDTRMTPARVARAAGRRLYRFARPFARVASKPFAPEVKASIYRSVRWLGGHRPTRPRPFAMTASMRKSLAAATLIDPSISWTAHSFENLPLWNPRDDGFAEFLDRALRELGDVRALIPVPWVGIGGADQVSINYAAALAALPEHEGRTAFLGTYLFTRSRLELLPAGVKYAHLDERWLGFPPEMRARFIAQLISLLDPDTIVSVNCFHLIQSLDVHSLAILSARRVYVTAFAFDQIPPGYPTNPITDDNQRRYLDNIGGVITDNTATARRLNEVLAMPVEQTLVHRQPVVQATPPLALATRAYNNEFFSPSNPFRLIWPHRLDPEKRPDALIEISRELRRRGIDAHIDIWGQRVLSLTDDELMRSMEAEGITYRGPYSGGLTALPTHEYHALMLTSESEGLPLVLVQSLLSGLPVIASAVGGVPDLISDRSSGMLAAGPDDTQGFADAIEALIGSRALRRSLIEQGFEKAATEHSWAEFTKRVAHDLVVPRHSDNARTRNLPTSREDQLP